MRNGEIRRRVRSYEYFMIGIDHNMAPVDIRANCIYKENAVKHGKIKNQMEYMDA